MTVTKGQILLPGRKAEELVLTIAETLSNTSGCKMYAGRPVPAIADSSPMLDVDATDTKLRLPLDEAWDPATKTSSLSDNGNGMTWVMGARRIPERWA